MKTIHPTNESPNSVEVPVEKIYQCEFCQDTGEIHFDESDGEGHYANTGVKKCDMCKADPEPEYA